MRKNEIIKSLQCDVKEKTGEILSITTQGVNYYDYDTAEIFFAFPETVTKKWVMEHIFIGDKAKKYNITKEWLTDVLFEAYGNEIKDAVMCLRRILIVDGEDDYHQAISEVAKTLGEDGDYLEEEFEYDDLDGVLGRKWHIRQCVWINVEESAKCSAELADEFMCYNSEFGICIASTLIHEIRHLMLETCFILPEEKYPVELGSEDAVEEFCREKTDFLPSRLRMINVPSRMIPNGTCKLPQE